MSFSKKVIVIPARYKSSRFPGKPLVQVCGSSMIQRVWNTAKKVAGISDVIIATDDSRIADHAQGFGAHVVMTASELRNGTERVDAAINSLNYEPDVIINFQGDAVITPHWILDDLVAVFDRDENVQMATLAVKLSLEEVKKTVTAKKAGDLAGVLVVFDQKFNALYFSRSLIPRHRDDDYNNWPLYRHIGIYAYTRTTLSKYIKLEMSPLEEVEQLEQLRALENGIPIKVALSDYRGRTSGSIDTPEDLVLVENIIKTQGEI